MARPNRGRKTTNKGDTGMNKYIIKNCPCYDCGFCTSKTVHVAGCSQYTDCIMKQIVELCKHYRKHSDCGRDCSSFGRFLDKLLDKLDIQEVE